MALQEKSESNKTFATIISDGSIRVRVEEGTQGAVQREYETADGKKGLKFEKVYKSINGKIESIKFKDTDFGQFIDIEIDDVILSLNTNGSFATDLMKKLPKVDLTKEVDLYPYSFLGDNGKNMKGITVRQDGEKVTSHFWDGEKSTNGIPEMEKNDRKISKDEWKIFFLNEKMFLIKFLEENVIPNVVTREKSFKESLDKAGIQYRDVAREDVEDSDINLESIP